MTVCPLAAWKPVQNHGGPMSAQLGLVLHVQQGNNSLAGWFDNPSADASSTFWVSKTGALEQYVDSDVCAWAQGSGNSTYQSVETEGYDTEALTPAQEDMLARLYAWGNQTYGWPNILAETPGTAGFGWHGMGGSDWGGHTGCPGDLRKPRRGPILAVAFGGAPAPAPGPAPLPPAPGGAPPWPGVLLENYTEGSGTATWQAQMAARGWAITVDDCYGDQSEQVCLQFQTEKALTYVDGIVGEETWTAAWTAPIT